jgi:hypothetical protein
VSTRDGFAEPYLGGLLADPAPRMVVLGLNPGAYVPSYQTRGGIFAKEIGQLGSYRAWAATGPPSTTAATATTRPGWRSPATTCRTPPQASKTY